MRILILLFTFLTFGTAASSQKIDELTISDDLLDAQEVYQVESSGDANLSSDYSFSDEYCLIGIHQDISTIEQCTFSLEAYKNAYEESDDFAIQFDNTNVEVEFECLNYDESSDEYSACEQILQIFYYINEFIEDGVVPDELSDKSELNTTQTIAKEHAEVYFIENVSKLNVIDEIEKFKTLLSNDALNDQLRNQKDVMLSLFHRLDNDSAKQSLACALLDFLNKYPEDINTMNLIYLGEGFDLNLCQ